MSFSFQKNVGLYNKPAISGDRANQNPTIYEVTNFLAGSGGVNMGGFAWRSPSYPESQVVASSSSIIPADGFVERTMNINGFTYDPASVTISEGENVTVARKGDFYVEADGAVSIGDTVYADTTDGVLLSPVARLLLTVDIRPRLLQAVLAIWLLSLTGN